MPDVDRVGWTLRRRAAWRVLRGRPVMYRMEFAGGRVAGVDGPAVYVDCRFDNVLFTSPDQVATRLARPEGPSDA